MTLKVIEQKGDGSKYLICWTCASKPETTSVKMLEPLTQSHTGYYVYQCETCGAGEITKELYPYIAPGKTIQLPPYLQPGGIVEALRDIEAPFFDAGATHLFKLEEE